MLCHHSAVLNGGISCTFLMVTWWFINVYCVYSCVWSVILSILTMGSVYKCKEHEEGIIILVTSTSHYIDFLDSATTAREWKMYAVKAFK